AHLYAVTGVRPSLLATDVEFRRSVDGQVARRLALHTFNPSSRGRFHSRGALKPCRFEIFDQTFATTLATVPALTIAAEAARRVEQVCAIDPDHARFQLRGDV